MTPLPQNVHICWPMFAQRLGSSGGTTAARRQWQREEPTLKAPSRPSGASCCGPACGCTRAGARGFWGTERSTFAKGSPVGSVCLRRARIICG